MIYFEQGRSAQLRKDSKAAVAAYEHAAQLRDDMPEVYRQMGILYLEGKQKTEGMSAFTEAWTRYKAARAPASVMDLFYAQVADLAKKAKVLPKFIKQWLKEAHDSTEQQAADGPTSKRLLAAIIE